MKFYQNLENRNIKDHAVSGEVFSLRTNSEFGYLETFPQPLAQNLMRYYESEDYISHTDSKRNAFEKIYHLVRKLSLKRKLRLINQYVRQSKKLLDIGCGTGDFLIVAKNNNWDITGVEPNEKARILANNKTKNAVFPSDSLHEFQDKNFDVITMWHVLEHIQDLEKYISVIKKIMSDNGFLIVAVPNHRSYDAKYYGEFWAAYDVPRHLWHFDKESVKRLFDFHGFQLIKIKPMWFDAFYVSLLSEKYKTGRTNFFKGILVGLLSNLSLLISGECSSQIYVLKKNI